MDNKKHMSHTENEPKLSEMRLKKWQEKKFREFLKLYEGTGIIDETPLTPYRLESEEE